MDRPKAQPERTTRLRPRWVAAFGLASGGLGALAAVLLAAGGPPGLAGGYIGALSLTLVFRTVAVVAGIAAVIAVLTDRTPALAVTLCAALFFVGYVGGYFYLQGSGMWYPSR
jgi:hypothetical protein